ncbi:hypothetical protein BDW59DRAFT_10034 [Aspergillus cavernicola]|uniref:Zn(2)-C6 fungal-type domain-containing protein n=1 Tax=Aspergillus cavernicola TaxID=176166 RepID=A0ABR4HMM0_9EURO
MDNPGWATAPYGRACAACAQAKCKCLVTEAGGSCARCRRLNRECHPARRTRKMNPLRKSVTAKTAQLEQRLDELTSLLHATGQSRPAVSDSRFSSASPVSSTLSSSVDTPPTEATPDDDILDSFRTNRLPFLPYIHIPPHVAAAEVKAGSPFLWRCLVTLHCNDTARRQKLHIEVKEVAAKALLVEGQRSLDLLQGILAYIGWIGSESQPRKVSLGPSMQMAVSLVLDIGLNRPPPQNPEILNSLVLKTGPGYCRPWISLVRTMNERRAVLGCFLLCSTVSHTLNRPDPLRWTPHMKECLDILAEAKQTPNDAVLVQLVRAQLVVHRLIKELELEYDAVDDREHAKAPFYSYIKALRSQIDNVRNLTPPELHQNKPLLLHLYHAETTIYETAMAKSASTTGEIDFARLNNLHACLNAITERFNVLFSLPVSAFAYMSSNVLFPSAHSLTTLLRLTTFEYPGWDLAVVRQTSELLSLTQQLSDRFSQAAEVMGFQNTPGVDPDCFTATAKILSGLRAGWASRLPDLQSTALQPVEVAPLPDIDLELVESWFSMQDFAWLPEYPMYGT